MHAEALIGTVLGTCRLQRLIGQGGMGAVFLAQQSRPSRQVAVKVLLPMADLTLRQHAAFLERFRRETNAAALLEHPHIVSVHESGEQEGLVYLVMPYVAGGTLRDQLEREGPFSLEQVVSSLDQLASALDFAHARGVIHRDIKPANILRTSEGRLLLTDFGLVKITAEGQIPQVHLTGAGVPVGTPEYMAPEQAIGGEVDARADLYSLGIILYQMVTGTTPFQGETPMQIAAQHIRHAPPSPRMLRPELPIAAEQVMLRALAKQPSERYNRAQDLADAFRCTLMRTDMQVGRTDSLSPAKTGRSTGLLSKTGKFPYMGTEFSSLEVTNTIDMIGTAKISTPMEGLRDQRLSVLKTSTGALVQPDQALKTTIKLTDPVKVIRVPVAGQPGLYMTGLLPVMAQDSHSEAEGKKGFRRWMKIALLLTVALLVFGVVGTFWLTHTHSTKPQVALLPTGTNSQATVVAQATATAGANIILADPLSQNIHNWLTTPPDVYSFKDGAYHITDHGTNGHATVLPANSYTGPLGYQLTMEEIKGDDASANNSFGMIFRFSQLSKGGKTITTFYTFEIVNIHGGEYQFWKYDDSNAASPWTKIWNQPFGSELHQGHGPQSTNTFKVFTNGPAFTFIVNGKTIASVHDGSLTGGTVGMIVNLNGTEVAFKNLLLTHT